MNILRFYYSHFRPVVNFNYVSSPKFVQSIGFPNVRRLLIKVLEVLKLSNKQHMGSFYATTCKTDCLQKLYKFCKKN